MDNEKVKTFKEQLDSEHNWPGLYIFKFIVPKDKQKEVENLFQDNATENRISKNGNYVSITARVEINNSDQVIQIYQDAHKIEGIIAL